jgi:hypothetical protein
VTLGTEVTRQLKNYQADRFFLAPISPHRNQGDCKRIDPNGVSRVHPVILCNYGIVSLRCGKTFTLFRSFTA